MAVSSRPVRAVPSCFLFTRDNAGHSYTVTPPGRDETSTTHRSEGLPVNRYNNIIIILYNSFSDTCRSHRKTVYQHRRHTHTSQHLAVSPLLRFINNGYLLLYNNMKSRRDDIVFFTTTITPYIHVCYSSLFDLVV